MVGSPDKGLGEFAGGGVTQVIGAQEDADGLGARGPGSVASHPSPAPEVPLPGPPAFSRHPGRCVRLTREKKVAGFSQPNSNAFRFSLLWAAELSQLRSAALE